MTTDTELRYLLRQEAGAAPSSQADWDHIVHRGRRHRRVARVRNGLTAGALAALAVVAAVAVTDIGDEEGQGVVADQPDGSTTPVVPVDPTNATITAARAAGSILTIVLPAADPDHGFDACTDLAPLVTETATDVTIDLQRHYEVPGGIWWPTCQSGPSSSWATVELEEPLGARSVLVGANRRELHVIDASWLLFPTTLPAPFDLPVHDELSEPASLGQPPDNWTFSWTAGDLVLTLGRWSLDGEHPEGCTGTDVPLRGTTGQACTGEGTSTIVNLTWAEGGALFILELADVGGNPFPTGIDLPAIAEDLEPLG